MIYLALTEMMATETEIGVQKGIVTGIERETVIEDEGADRVIKIVKENEGKTKTRLRL